MVSSRSSILPASSAAATLSMKVWRVATVTALRNERGTFRHSMLPTNE
jgi:hypothetical protein